QPSLVRTHLADASSDSVGREGGRGGGVSGPFLSLLSSGVRGTATPPPPLLIGTPVSAANRSFKFGREGLLPFSSVGSGGAGLGGAAGASTAGTGAGTGIAAAAAAAA
ncbi:hypothetical protein PFISCL1PPCAC_18309, partial [Pristionchus fissidentatus]